MNRQWHPDFYLGGFYLAFGGAAAATCLTTLELGTARSWGPGMFPSLLGGMLMAFGVKILFDAFRSTEGPRPLPKIPLRTIIVVCTALAVFALSIETLGLPIAVFLTSFIASLASRESRVVRSLIASVCLAAFCVIVFAHLLGLPISILGTFFE